MPHNVFGKKLNRDTGQRQALLKGLAGALIRSEAIETTEAKAKAAKGLIEKIITQAKRANLSDVREIESVIGNKELIDKLVHEIAPRFKARSGGYLRLIKIGNRTGDNAPMVRMELVAAGESAPVEKVAPSIQPKAMTKKASPAPKSSVSGKTKAPSKAKKG